jgi:hypothetical protein
MTFIDEVRKMAVDGQEQRKALAEQALRKAILRAAQIGRKQVALREIDFLDQNTTTFVLGAAQELEKQGGFRLTKIEIPKRLDPIWFRPLSRLFGKAEEPYVYYVLEWD